MPSDSIFLLDGEDGLQEMEQAPYEREELLQRLLKQHPSLLAGQQIDGEDPPRWLLVSREMGRRQYQKAGARWSQRNRLSLSRSGRSPSHPAGW